METLMRTLTGALSALCALFAPIGGLVLSAFCFIAVDFVSGVAASRHRARRLSRPWAFASRRAWDTVFKLCCAVVGIVLTWLVDRFILSFAELHLAKLFTGFLCGVELWSFLENAAELSSYAPFRWLRRFLMKRMGVAMGFDEPSVRS